MFRALKTLASILLIAFGARSPVFDWSPACPFGGWDR
jgi:hypothetical protein